MKKYNQKEFEKRYDKFKNNNLPTLFWDKERQTYEYVYFDKRKEGEYLEINTSLVSALENIAFTGFYYPFTSKYI